MRAVPHEQFTLGRAAGGIDPLVTGGADVPRRPCTVFLALAPLGRARSPSAGRFRPAPRDQHLRFGFLAVGLAAVLVVGRAGNDRRDRAGTPLVGANNTARHALVGTTGRSGSLPGQGAPRAEPAKALSSVTGPAPGVSMCFLLRLSRLPR
ncbi:hypothetical protein GCM10029964_024490 [Kibdelosporangium lantanae]